MVKRNKGSLYNDMCIIAFDKNNIMEGWMNGTVLDCIQMLDDRRSSTDLCYIRMYPVEGSYSLSRKYWGFGEQWWLEGGFLTPKMLKTNKRLM